VVRIFARLKLRLIRNGLRTPQYALLFTLGASAAGVLALLGFIFLSSVRNDPIASDAVIVTFSAITVMWIVVPLLGFGTDETLDPQRLVLLPLTRGQLLCGLLTAALVGIAPVAVAFALTGAVIAVASGALSVLLIAASIVLTILFCVVASRVLIGVLAPLLRSRRGRDVMVMTVLLAAFVSQAFRLFAARGGTHDARKAFAQIADHVKYTPFGWGGLSATEAGAGHIAAALIALAGMTALIAGLLWAWSNTIPRAMTASDISAPEAAKKPKRRTALYPRWMPILPHNRMGATAAKELRYYLRDPRRRGPLVAALIVPALFLFESMRDAHVRPAASTMLALVTLLPASGLTLNQFGMDGAALWANVVAGSDPRADLTGKNLATALFVVPLIGLPAIATASVTGGWAYLPVTFGVAPGALGVILAIGDLVSVRAPYALPDRKNPLAANPGQGCVGGLAAMGALLADAIVLVPVGVVTAIALLSLPLGVATVVAVVFSTVYGGAFWYFFGVRRSSSYVEGRMPELLDAVSPRHAG
jgi:ABC-2 type transport system permease protein